MTRNILSALLLLLMALPAAAQPEQEHLKFMGISIDGPAGQFVQQLKKKGFREAGSSQESTLLTGTFAGIPESTIVVSSQGTVSSVTVVFPAQSAWSNLETEYDYFKRMLTLKYGAPALVTETVDSEYIRPENMMLYLYKDLITWESNFETPQGVIILQIDDFSDYGKGFVGIHYIDDINRMKRTMDAMDDL